jgi:hypothetical protein
MKKMTVRRSRFRGKTHDSNNLRHSAPQRLRGEFQKQKLPNEPIFDFYHNLSINHLHQSDVVRP